MPNITSKLPVHSTPLINIFSNPTASGQTQLVAAVTGKRITVWWVKVMNAGSSTNRIKFQSASTDLTPPDMLAASGGGYVIAPPNSYCFRTVAGQALNANLSATGDITITGQYTEE